MIEGQTGDTHRARLGGGPAYQQQQSTILNMEVGTNRQNYYFDIYSVVHCQQAMTETQRFLRYQQIIIYNYTYV